MPRRKKVNDVQHLGLNQLMTHTGKVITFNEEQIEGINKIRDWLKNGQTFFTLAGYAGTGKAQPLYSKLYTPDGYTTMGDINVGDLVIGSNGKPTKVLNVFPQGIKPLYRVTFSDGFYVDCCGDHLWKVRTFKDRNCQRAYKFKYNKNKEYNTILSTKDMLNNVLYHRNDKVNTIQYNYKIDINLPVQFNKKELPINPYVLGVLIGDGGLTGGSVKFSSIDDEIISRVTNIINEEYNSLKVRRISNTIGYSNLHQRIRAVIRGSFPHPFRSK